MKGILLCCLWMVFDLPASGQTDSTTQIDTSVSILVHKVSTTKPPFNSYMFSNAKVPLNIDKYSMLSNYRPVNYPVFKKTPFQTFMEVSGTVLSLIIDPRGQPYIPPPR